MSKFDTLVASTGAIGTSKEPSDQSSLGSGESTTQESEKRGTLAGSYTKRAEERRRTRYGKYADGEGAARMPHVWFIVGRGDFHGTATSAEDQERRRTEKMRTRSTCSSGGIQVCYAFHYFQRNIESQLLS